MNWVGRAPNVGHRRPGKAPRAMGLGQDPMTALTHQLTSRTLVAAAFVAAAVAGLIVALALGISATSGPPGGSHSGPATTGSQPAPGPGFRASGCLLCDR
jgi:hypothetical protein